METLKPLSEIFLVTFSILYGIMLNSCLGLELFPFGKLGYTCCEKIGRRILKSLVIINVLPFVTFSIILYWLQGAKAPLTWFTGIGVFFLSMIVFAFYKIMAVCVLYQKGKWFYWDIEKCVLEPAKTRVMQMVKGASWQGQFIGFLLYIDLFVFGLILTFWESFISSIPILVFAITFSVFLNMVIICLTALIKTDS